MIEIIVISALAPALGAAYVRLMEKLIEPEPPKKKERK
jgi:hypothetical protein